MLPDSRGEFVAFSGLDGAGKSTLASAVSRALRARGLRVANLELGPSRVWSLCDALRSVDPGSEAFLDGKRLGLALNLERFAFVSDHVAPARHSHDVVMLQRYFLDWIAVGRAYGSDDVEVRALQALESMTGLAPVAFYIDTPPAEARRRIAARASEPDERDSEERLERAHEAYQQQVGRRNDVVTISWTRSTQEQVRAVLDHLTLERGEDQHGAG